MCGAPSGFRTPDPLIKSQELRRLHPSHGLDFRSIRRQRRRCAAAKARHLKEKGISAIDIAKMLSVSRATVYRHRAIDESLSA
jgi:DNA invertase Pin-like site-specific DNA recombinase